MKPMSNDPDMLEEYDFSKGIRGKYAKRYSKGTNVVIIDPDVAEFFPDENSVNGVFPVSLSSLIFFSGGRQLFNQQHGRLIVHNSRASICQDRGIVQRNVAAAF